MRPFVKKTRHMHMHLHTEAGKERERGRDLEGRSMNKMRTGSKEEAGLGEGRQLSSAKRKSEA